MPQCQSFTGSGTNDGILKYNDKSASTVSSYQRLKQRFTVLVAIQRLGAETKTRMQPRGTHGSKRYVQAISATTFASQHHLCARIQARHRPPGRATSLVPPQPPDKPTSCSVAMEKERHSDAWSPLLRPGLLNL